MKTPFKDQLVRSKATCSFKHNPNMPPKRIQTGFKVVPPVGLNRVPRGRRLRKETNYYANPNILILGKLKKFKVINLVGLLRGQP